MIRERRVQVGVQVEAERQRRGPDRRPRRGRQVEVGARRLGPDHGAVQRQVDPIPGAVTRARRQTLEDLVPNRVEQGTLDRPAGRRGGAAQEGPVPVRAGLEKGDRRAQLATAAPVEGARGLAGDPFAACERALPSKDRREGVALVADTKER